MLNQRTIEIPIDQLPLVQRAIKAWEKEKARSEGEEEPKDSRPCTGCVRQDPKKGCLLYSCFCVNSSNKPYYLSVEAYLERERRIPIWQR